MANEDQADSNEIVNILVRLLSGQIDSKTLARVTKKIAKSVKITRKGVTLSGKTMADVMFLIAPKIPIRDLERIQSEYGGMNGASLASKVIKGAARNSAAVGGAIGALASAGEFAPPFWVMLPVELVLETLLIACFEMKMIGEVHAIYGQPILGTPEERGVLLLDSWAERRGVRLEDLASSGIKGAFNKSARAQLTQVIRRRLMIRAVRNLSSLAPLLIGAVAGAELNRRATRDLGDDLVHDLSRRK